LQIGLTTEGTTDVRFLKNIIWKTFQAVAFECSGEIEVYEPEYISNFEGDFASAILKISQDHSYFHVICIHRDSDNATIDNVMEHLIEPTIEKVEEFSGANCKNIVPVIPVQMSEAWMLADKELLKRKIGTLLSDKVLGFP